MEEMDFGTYCMTLVATAGEAKTEYVEAIALAKTGEFAAAREAWEAANAVFKEAHEAHFALMQSGLGASEALEQILLIHAEDQLADAETYKLFSQEFIELYEKLA